MKFLKKSAILLLSLTIATSALFAKETLKSTEEEYYDFLSLTGNVIRPTLGYRTLSDSEWSFVESTETVTNEDGTTSKKTTTTFDSSMNVWKNNNLGNKYLISGNENLKWKIYGPSWYNSYNTAAPYGQNDGALWQGRGYNTSLTAGARLEAYGLELTVKPVVCFSQNAEFEIMSSAYDSAYGYFWGYGNSIGIDLPQRFGDSPFFTFDWGDTEIRYTWKMLTVGAGTQAAWLGPAWLNPMLGSNNAATYPKFDFGIRKTSVTLPWLNLYIGEIEARAWIGYLSESDYFDNDDTNNHNRINGFNISYAPSFIPGLTVGATKVCLSKWGDFQWYYLNPFYDGNTIGGNVGEDQKASVYADWLVPKGGIEIYGEIGIDDYTPNGIKGFLIYPFDTMIYTIGVKKTLNPCPEKSIFGELIFEWNCFEKNIHRATGNSTYTYYFHSQISQGYTNKGQMISCGTGPGTNSQYLGYRVYYTKGTSEFFIQRYNVDDDYAYLQWVNNKIYCYKSNIVFGGQSSYFIKQNIYITLGACYDLIINPYYNDILNEEITYIHNFQLSFSISYKF